MNVPGWAIALVIVAVIFLVIYYYSLDNSKGDIEKDKESLEKKILETEAIIRLANEKIEQTEILKSKNANENTYNRLVEESKFRHEKRMKELEDDYNAVSQSWGSQITQLNKLVEDEKKSAESDIEKIKLKYQNQQMDYKAELEKKLTELTDLLAKNCIAGETKEQCQTRNRLSGAINILSMTASTFNEGLKTYVSLVESPIISAKVHRLINAAEEANIFYQSNNVTNDSKFIEEVKASLTVLTPEEYEELKKACSEKKTPYGSFYGAWRLKLFQAARKYTDNLNIFPYSNVSSFSNNTVDYWIGMIFSNQSTTYSCILALDYLIIIENTYKEICSGKTREEVNEKIMSYIGSRQSNAFHNQFINGVTFSGSTALRTL